MKDGKPTGGYDRLKIKYDKLKKQNEQLQTIVEKQTTKISCLAADLHNEQAEAFRQKQLAQLYWEWMGCFRQWWFAIYVRWFE